MAQEFPTDEAERKRQMALMEEEKAWLTKQKELEAARKDLAKAREETAAQESEQAEALKELADRKAEVTAKKDLLSAEKDLATAELDAKVAQEIGVVKSASYSGAVELGQKSGTIEAHLLASQAIREGSQKLVAKIGAATLKDKKVVVVPHGAITNFRRLVEFQVQKELLSRRLDAAAQQAEDALPRGLPAGLAPLAYASAALEGIKNIGTFFKTDYTVGGVDVTLNDTLLLSAVIEALRQAGVKVSAPSMFDPTIAKDGLDEIIKQLDALATKRDKVTRNLYFVGEELKTAGDDAVKSKLNAAKAAGEQVLQSYDGFVVRLQQPEQSGAVPIVELARELAYKARMDASGVTLLVRLEHAGGGYYVRKNLLSGIGFMPLFFMGGGTISFVLFEKDGDVTASGVIPVHGGFVKSKNIATKLQ